MCLALLHNLFVSKKAALMLILFSLIASSILAIQPIKAGSTTIIVPDDYSTISLAIENAVDGDTIFVKNGTYIEVLVIDKALSLKGEDKDATVINGGKAATVILIRHDNVEITGFTVIYDKTQNSPQPIWMWSTRLAGIHLLNAKNCNIFGNSVLDCGCGIWLYEASQNSVTDNYIFRNDYGLRVEDSANNNIARNTVTGNWGGIWLISAPHNTLRSNSVVGNVRNFGMVGDELSAYDNDVDTSNTVDGRPIYYWIGVWDRAIPSDAGCVVLVNCVGVTVKGLSFAKNQDAILIVSSWDSVVLNNNIAECGTGVRIYDSHNDSVIGNIINSNVGIEAGGNGTQISENTIRAGSTGIIMNGCYQTVSENTVEAGTFGSGNNIVEGKGSYNKILRNRLAGQTYVGIVLEGSYNAFYENVIPIGEMMRVSGDWNIIAKNTFTDSGVTVLSGSNNVVCANRITDGMGLGVGGHNNVYYANHIENNHYVGVAVSGTEERVYSNTLYHNNLINNEIQVKNWGANSANFWDNGSEGNYWSDYTGVDANGDGIGDTPYFVESETFDESVGVVEVVHGLDNYPLIVPFDISIVDVELPEWEYVAPSSSSSPSPSTEPTPSVFPSSSPPPEGEIIAPTESPETQQQETEPFPTTTVAASAASVAVFGAGLAVYFKKRNH